jgi:prolyl oligopeptidase PreP (S9A serine peptidase family)
LIVEGVSGHFGGTTKSTQIEQTADRYAFLMDMLGMPAPQSLSGRTGID